MLLKALGNDSSPAILFFHPIGLTGDFSLPLAECLKDRYYCIMPTSTASCRRVSYMCIEDELRSIRQFLNMHKIRSLAMVVASSTGVALAQAFLEDKFVPVGHVFFDGGKFYGPPKAVSMAALPFKYAAMKSLYLTKGGTAGAVLGCEGPGIKACSADASRYLRPGNFFRLMSDSIAAVPSTDYLAQEQEKTYWAFGGSEKNFKYRRKLKLDYKYGNFPVFDGFSHLQFQLSDPKEFSDMLSSLIENDELPALPFLIYRKHQG